MDKKQVAESVDKIKTGSFERRLALTRIGLMAGTRVAGQVAVSMFSSKEKRVEKRKKMLSKQEYNIAYYYTKIRTTYKDASAEQFKKAFYDVMVGKLNIPIKELKLPKIKREEYILQ